MQPVLLALLAFISTSGPVDVKGTICRLNRNADRFIVLTDNVERMPVALRENANVTWEKTDYRAEDIRPGDRVRVVGIQTTDRVEADAIDVQLKIGETILDALLGLQPPLIGRFGVREAKTEFFSFGLPDGRYVRVDAKSAYGPKGRVWVSTLRSGDLLMLSGKWKSNDLYQASGIRVLTNEESPRCKPVAGENKEAKGSRETVEQKFLDGYDPISDEELERMLAEEEDEP